MSIRISVGAYIVFALSLSACKKNEDSLTEYLGPKGHSIVSDLTTDSKGVVIGGSVAKQFRSDDLFYSRHYSVFQGGLIALTGNNYYETNSGKVIATVRGGYSKEGKIISRQQIDASITASGFYGGLGILKQKADQCITLENTHVDTSTYCKDQGQTYSINEIDGKKYTTKINHLTVRPSDFAVKIADRSNFSYSSNEEEYKWDTQLAIELLTIQQTVNKSENQDLFVKIYQSVPLMLNNYTKLDAISQIIFGSCMYTRDRSSTNYFIAALSGNPAGDPPRSFNETRMNCLNDTKENFREQFPWDRYQ